MAVVDTFQIVGDARLQFDLGGEVNAFAVVTYPSTDTTAPALDPAFSPAPGSITTDQAITLPIADATSNLAALAVWATFGDGSAEVIFDGADLSAAYIAGSSVTGALGTPAIELELVRAGGWPNASMTITALAIDSVGNSAALTGAYTITNPPAPPDTVAPVVENVVTSPGRLDPASFEIFDAGGIRRVFVAALFPDGSYDVVHDGDAFGPKYAGISSRTVVGPRTFYVLRRRRGWTLQPTIRVFPIDLAGNEG